MRLRSARPRWRQAEWAPPGRRSVEGGSTDRLEKGREVQSDDPCRLRKEARLGKSWNGIEFQARPFSLRGSPEVYPGHPPAPQRPIEPKGIIFKTLRTVLGDPGGHEVRREPGIGERGKRMALRALRREPSVQAGPRSAHFDTHDRPPGSSSRSGAFLRDPRARTAIPCRRS